MGIFDRLKRKTVKSKPAEPEIKIAVAPKNEVPVSDKGGNSHLILVRPLLTEKSLSRASEGRYVFMVNKNANKPEIRKSIQKLYHVTVEQVKIINLPSKKRRYGKASGETSAHKKAVVILKKGEKIPGIV